MSIEFSNPSCPAGGRFLFIHSCALYTQPRSVLTPKERGLGVGPFVPHRLSLKSFCHHLAPSVGSFLLLQHHPWDKGHSCKAGNPSVCQFCSLHVACNHSFLRSCKTLTIPESPSWSPILWNAQTPLSSPRNHFALWGQVSPSLLFFSNPPAPNFS